MSPASRRATDDAVAAPTVGLPEWRALAGLMGAMALGFGYLAWAQGSAIEGLRRALDEGLAARPPIAVIDYAALGAAVAAGQAPEQIEPLFVAMKARSAALGAQGVLVINRAAVDAAPPHIVFGAAAPGEQAAGDAATDAAEDAETDTAQGAAADAPAIPAGALRYRGSTDPGRIPAAPPVQGPVRVAPTTPEPVAPDAAMPRPSRGSLSEAEARALMDAITGESVAPAGTAR
jgi:hypothetical protein